MGLLECHAAIYGDLLFDTQPCVHGYDLGGKPPQKAFLSLAIINKTVRSFIAVWAENVLAAACRPPPTMNVHYQNLNF